MAYALAARASAPAAPAAGLATMEVGASLAETRCVREACSLYDVTPEALLSGARGYRVVYARMLLQYLLVTYLEYSHGAAGRFINRSRQAAEYARKAVELRMENDSQFEASVDEIGIRLMEAVS